MVLGIIWDCLLFGILFLFIEWMAMKEFYKISLGERFVLQQKAALLTGAAAFAAVAGHFFYGLDLMWLALPLVLLVLIPVSCIFKPSHADFADVAFIYAGLLYIALPISLSPMIVTDGTVFDGTILLSLFIIIWMSDVGAYCLGTAFGQKPDSRKLAPTISPKKSWWGFWSGVAFGIAAAVGLHFLTWFPFSIWHCIAIGAITSVAGVCGDLVESLWKRYFGVKDSGNCIPGHGGMLDRFDSSLVAIPVAAAYMALAGLL